MTRYVLGLNAYHGDASACLLADGQVVLALEEERLNRIKHCAGFPTLAVRACLAAGGIRPAALTGIAIARQPLAHAARRAWYALGRILRGGRARRAVGDRLRNLGRVGGVRADVARALDVGVHDLPGVHAVEHHLAHLASTYYASGFDEAALVSIDGFGDFVSTKLAVGRGDHMRVLGEVPFPHSAGILYTAVTQLIGFPHYGDEGKTMGLAAYGEPRFADALGALVRFTAHGFELDQSWFTHAREGVEMSWADGSPTLGPVYGPRFVEAFGPARAAGAPITDRERDLAASVQVVLERIYGHLLGLAGDRVATDRLCLAGGVAYNSVANGKVRRLSRFRDVYILSAAGDSGTALGAAYLAHLAAGGARPPPLASAFLGPEYPADVCRAALAAPGLEAEELDDADLLATTARALARGEVVGWFQGRLEFGPRALGNRSLLADPRRPEMKAILNARVKHREEFRPFAPSVLEEEAAAWFVDAVPSPDMLVVQVVRPERRAQVPAITHADGSARVQTVTRAANQRYHALIAAFAAETGVPMVLNTSFNDNEPVVATPADAVACFQRTRIDRLVLGNLVVVRGHQA